MNRLTNIIQENHKDHFPALLFNFLGEPTWATESITVVGDPNLSKMLGEERSNWLTKQNDKIYGLNVHDGSLYTSLEPIPIDKKKLKEHLDMFSSGIGSVRLKSDPAYKGKSNGKISMAVIMDRPWYINSEHEEYFTSSVTDPSTIVAARVWRNDNDRYVLLKQDNIQTLLCVHSTGSKPVYGSELDIRTKRAA